MERAKGTSVVIAAAAVGALLAVRAVVASPIATEGKAVTAVKAVTETVAREITAQKSFVNLPGATLSVTVPADTKAILLVRFAAESDCTYSNLSTQDLKPWCSVRILVGGVEAKPAAGADFAFDTGRTSSINDIWEAHAMERISDVLAPGTYQVTVQWMVTADRTTFRLDDWSLVAERVKA